MDIIYLDTAIFTVFAIVVVCICLWASYTIIRFKEYAQDRDKVYMDRYDNLEKIIKTEFIDAINELKKVL